MVHKLYKLLILIFIVYWVDCKAPQTIVEEKLIRKKLGKTGIQLSSDDFYSKTLPSLKNKKAALITNPSGIGIDPEKIKLEFKKNEVSIELLIGLEHGFLGLEEDFENKPMAMDPEFQVPIYHIYRLKQEQLAEAIKPVQVIILDVQDMAMRCYTYLTVLKRIMDVMDDSQELVVLDHISPGLEVKPSGDYMLKENYNFAGEFPSLLLSGLTMGESAIFYNKEFLSGKKKIRIVTVKNYKRGMLYEETGLPWYTPSPNLPTLDSARNYMALVLLEGVNVSVGRGTQAPFVYFGAPWLNKNKELANELNSISEDKYYFQTVYFKPTFGPYSGEICKGLRMNLINPSYDPLKLAYNLISIMKKLHPDTFKWRGASQSYFIDKLWGNERFRNSIDSSTSYSDFKKSIEKLEKEYTDKIKKYYLY